MLIGLPDRIRPGALPERTPGAALVNHRGRGGQRHGNPAADGAEAIRQNFPLLSKAVALDIIICPSAKNAPWSASPPSGQLTGQGMISSAFRAGGVCSFATVPFRLGRRPTLVKPPEGHRGSQTGPPTTKQCSSAGQAQSVTGSCPRFVGAPTAS
jgi:hypothetical protein